LRGIDLDHGTDFAISVAGVPLNLPTHAHGQGYADANFLIPELIGEVRFSKGPYSASHGDFAAGAIRQRRTHPRGAGKSGRGGDHIHPARWNRDIGPLA
jgi:hypothetical protein